jgi:hypothetical protein
MPTTVASLNSTQPWRLTLATPAEVNTQTGEVAITPANLTEPAGAFTTLTVTGDAVVEGTLTSSGILTVEDGGASITGGLAVPTGEVNIGNGTGNAYFDFLKSPGGASGLRLYAGGMLRWVVGLNTTEDLIIERYSGAGALQDTVTLGAAGGAQLPASLDVGTTIESGGTITSHGDIAVEGSVTIGNGVTGGLSVNTGDIYLAINGRARLQLPEAADDAAAALLSPSVPIGGLYHTAGAVKMRRS